MLSDGCVPEALRRKWTASLYPAPERVCKWVWSVGGPQWVWGSCCFHQIPPNPTCIQTHITADIHKHTILWHIHTNQKKFDWLVVYRCHNTGTNKISLLYAEVQSWIMNYSKITVKTHLGTCQFISFLICTVLDCSSYRLNFWELIIWVTSDEFQN